MKTLRIICIVLLLLSASALAEDTLILPTNLNQIEDEAFAGDLSISEVVIPDGTLSIGSRAFANSSLSVINLPDSLTYIADDAFEGCENLLIYTRKYSHAYNWCFRLGMPYIAYSIENDEVTIQRYTGNDSTFVIPDEIKGFPVTAISDSAFWQETLLTAVYCPDSLKTIGRCAFTGCSNLAEIRLNEGLVSIGERAFEGCGRLKEIDLPDSLTTIAPGAFGDTGLVNVIIPQNVAELSATAFDCSDIVSIQLPDSMTVIGNRAFNYCRKLTQINFPASLTTIGESAFYCCEGLTQITLPNGIEEIGRFAFSECSSLESINLPTTITTIGENAFGRRDSFIATVAENSYAHTWCVENGVNVNVIRGDYEHVVRDGSAVITAYIGSDKFVTIPATMDGLPVTEIAAQAFMDNSGLTTLVIPDTVTTIGNRAFSGCSSLESVQLPARLESIGDESFAGTKLTEIVIPKKVTSISDSAFANCDSLTTFYATAGSDGATAISNCGFEFIDSRDTTMLLSQSEDTSGTPQLSIVRYTTDVSELVLPATFYDIKIVAIGDGAFSGNAALTKITLSEGLLSIGEKAFNGTGLTRVNLPASLTSIADNAFDGCGDLLILALNGSYGSEWCANSGLNYYLDTDPNAESDFTVENLTTTTCAITGYTGERTIVVIPEKIGGRTVTTIAMRAFDENKQITAVTIPSTVTEIEDYAFHNCSNMTRLVLNDGLKTIRALAFCNCGFSEVVVPDSVTTIKGGAFEWCRKLTSIKLPNGLTIIEDSLLYACDKLESITIPNTVKIIRKSAFQGAGLTSLTVPSSVKTIEGWAFYNARNLKTVYLPSSVTSIGEGAFLASVEFHCPKGSAADKWATANGNPVVYE